MSDQQLRDMLFEFAVSLLKRLTDPNADLDTALAVARSMIGLIEDEAKRAESGALIETRN